MCHIETARPWHILGDYCHSSKSPATVTQILHVLRHCASRSWASWLPASPVPTCVPTVSGSCPGLPWGPVCAPITAIPPCAIKNQLEWATFPLAAASIPSNCSGPSSTKHLKAYLTPTQFSEAIKCIHKSSWSKWDLIAGLKLSWIQTSAAGQVSLNLFPSGARLSHAQCLNQVHCTAASSPAPISLSRTPPALL